jgi:hypothetical protein
MRLVTALRNGAIDVVIFESKVLPLWSERILVALPEGHQLATKKSIYWTISGMRQFFSASMIRDENSKIS